MTALADFLVGQRVSIIELFMECARRMMAPNTTVASELIDHLPDILHELAEAVRDGASPRATMMGGSEGGKQHGRQRLRLGYDLDAVVREYGLLRDCIYDLLEKAPVTPTLRELRILADGLSAATAESVTHFVRQRKANLEDERRQLLDLFEQAPGFVAFMRGRDFVFERANAAYYQLVGHRDILGKPARIALPEVEGQGYFELLDGVFTTGEPFVGYGLPVELQREPGAPLTSSFVDLIYQPIRNVEGEIIGILAQGHDVSEMKRQETQRLAAEAALRVSEERYRTLFESIDDGYCLVEMIENERGELFDYRFLDVNAAFAQQTGVEKVVGRTAREAIPGLDESWFQIYGRVALTGESVRFENHAPALGRWFDVYASRVGAPGRRQVAIVFKDTTARKQGEQERERLYELERAARREAEDASRLRDDFLATVSHELRTPLASILGWTQMLRSGSLPAEKHERALETVERNARAQAQLIEDLLDVSRILAGKLRLEIEPVALDAVVTAALETVHPAAVAKDIHITTALSGKCIVLGDPHRLQQVVWNLASNAVKFTPRGGSMDVAVRRTDDGVEVVVSDTGRGIAPALQTHIFDRFRQADGSTTRSHGGLGLGLSIVRQLVELHGGVVSVASAGEGQGARFVVWLPEADAEPERRSSTPRALAAQPGVTPQPSLSPTAELAGLSVVVVDDEEDARELFRTLLETNGARVWTASSAAEGLERVRAHRPSLILSDIGMPGEDGYTFIRNVRALPADTGGDTPAVALTAFARPQDRMRALLAGFNSYIAKPVEPPELYAVIVSVVRRRN